MSNYFMLLKNYLKEQYLIFSAIDFSARSILKKDNILDILLVFIVAMMVEFPFKKQYDYTLLEQKCNLSYLNVVMCCELILLFALIIYPRSEKISQATRFFCVSAYSGIVTLFADLIVVFISSLINESLTIQKIGQYGILFLVILFFFFQLCFITGHVNSLAQNSEILRKLDVRVRFAFLFIVIIYALIMRFFL